MGLLKSKVGLLSIVLALGTIAQIGYAYWERQGDDYSNVEKRSYNEATKTAVDLELEQARVLYQVCIGFLIALWGLVVAKKDDARIALGDHPTLIMLLASSVLLVASIVWYILFGDTIKDAFAVAGATAGDRLLNIPDVFDMKFHRLHVFQRRFVVQGGISAVITLIAAHRVPRPPENN